MATITESSFKVYPHTGRSFICTVVEGRRSATFAFTDTYTRVIVHNASNRCWRGMGRIFWTVADMTAYYRSPAMQAMIAAAVAANTVAGPDTADIVQVAS